MVYVAAGGILIAVFLIGFVGGFLTVVLSRILTRHRKLKYKYNFGTEVKYINMGGDSDIIKNSRREQAASEFK